jgi:hypothetical protein
MKTNGSMNRCYRLVWSHVQQAWMAVAETSRGRSKASSSVGSGVAGAVLGAAGLGLMLLGTPAHAAPQGGQVTAGSASVSQSGTTTTIAQSSQNVSLSWQRFNVSAAETVNFVQPSAAAIAVNRIYDTQGSQILGRIDERRGSGAELVRPVSVERSRLGGHTGWRRPGHLRRVTPHARMGVAQQGVLRWGRANVVPWCRGACALADLLVDEGLQVIGQVNVHRAGAQSPRASQ